MAGEKKQRISATALLFLTLFAVIFDIIGFIPVVNWVSSPFAYLIFIAWFLILGVSFKKPTRWITGVVVFIIEMIPFISWLPGITVWVLTIAISAILEDRVKVINSVMKRVEKKTDRDNKMKRQQEGAREEVKRQEKMAS